MCRGRKDTDRIWIFILGLHQNNTVRDTGPINKYRIFKVSLGFEFYSLACLLHFLLNMANHSLAFPSIPCPS